MEVGTVEVREFIRKEAKDWEDEEVGRARFKAFNGQKSNWEPTYRFCNHLLLSIAHHFHLIIISPSQVLLSFLSLSLSLSPFIVSNYLGFFFFF